MIRSSRDMPQAITGLEGGLVQKLEKWAHDCVLYSLLRNENDRSSGKAKYLI